MSTQNVARRLSRLEVPARAPKHIYQALLAVCRADAADRLDQRRIDRLTLCKEPTSNSDGKGLLEDLGLVSIDMRLMEDVAQGRGDPQRLADLLKRRLRAALIAAGCSIEEVDFVGDPSFTVPRLRNHIAGLGLFAEDRVANPNRAQRMQGALTTLCKIILDGPGEANLEREFLRRSGSRASADSPPTFQSAKSEPEFPELMQKAHAAAMHSYRWPMLVAAETSWMHVLFDEQPAAEHWQALAELARHEAERARRMEGNSEDSQTENA